MDVTLCGPTSATIDGSCGVAGLNAYAASSSQPGGVLKAETRLSAAGAVVTVSSSAPSDVDNAGFTSNAFAGLSDRVTFGGVAPSIIRFNYYIDGTLTNTLPAGSATYANSGIDLLFRASQTVPATSLPFAFAYRNNIIGTTSQSRMVAQSGFVDFVLAGANALSFSLGLSSYVDVGGGGGPGRPLTGMGESDFFSTALIGIQAIDAQGNDITSQAGLTFASGAAYAAIPAATTVPEPGTWALLGTGLLAIGGVSVRRKRSTV